MIDEGLPLRRGGTGASVTAHAIAVENADKVAGLVAELVRQPTHEPRQCAAAALLARSAMSEAGFDVEEHYPVNREGVALPLVIGWSGPRTLHPDVLLCAHLDTSPAGGGWTRDPYGARMEDGFLYGRGAVVSKSDVASFIYAAHAAYGAANAGTIAVAITSDEGNGGEDGAAYLLNTLAIRPRVAVFPGFTDVVTTAHSGCVQIKVRIVGTACHQSLLPPAEDAMRVASQLCSAIYALADRLDADSDQEWSPTVNVTRVCGGTVFGMAPREIEIWIDRRVTPTETVQAAHDELLAVLDGIAAKPPVTISHEVVRIAESMRPSPSQGAFTKLLSEEAEEAFGKDLRDSGSTLYTDARWYSNAGIPTVMYGAGEADIRVSGANGADERVSQTHLTQATVILARAITRFILEKDRP